jgi:hypothetical protein
MTKGKNQHEPINGKNGKEPQMEKVRDQASPLLRSAK